MSKTVFIAGASRGIGKALAIEFSRNGWNTFLTARNTENLQLLKDEILSKYAVSCEIGKLDITIESDYDKSFHKCLQIYSSIDLVILNSGISKSVKLKNIDLETIRQIYETNFFGIVTGMKKSIDIFLNQKYGKLAVVSSLADARGIPGSAAYSSSKAAISQISDAARIELRNSNIEVVLIKPGFVTTDMTAKHTFHMPFLISAERAAIIIYKGLKRNKMRIYFPFPTAILTYLLKLIPSFLFEFLFRFWKGEDSQL